MEINKCPFCGEPGEIDYSDYCTFEGYAVQCGECYASGPEITDKDSNNPQEDAIKKWNSIRVVKGGL